MEQPFNRPKKLLDVLNSGMYEMTLSGPEIGINYKDAVVVANLTRLMHLKQALTDWIERECGLETTDFIIVAVGSDGKLERYTQSQTELVLIYHHDRPEIKIAVQDFFANFSDNLMLEDGLGLTNEMQTTPFTYVEKDGLETIEGLHKFSYINGDKKAAFPDFLLNSTLLCGDSEVFIKLKRAIYLETNTTKRIRSAMKSQTSEYRFVCRTGRLSNSDSAPVLFQITSDGVGIQYYDESVTCFGFKIGPIRLVQRTLDRIFTKLAKDTEILNDIIDSKLGSNTAERITYLARKQILNEDFAAELISAYFWFLKEYHKVQRKYMEQSGSRMVATTFDVVAFNHYMGIVDEFGQLLSQGNNNQAFT